MEKRWSMCIKLDWSNLHHESRRWLLPCSRIVCLFIYLLIALIILIFFFVSLAFVIIISSLKCLFLHYQSYDCFAISLLNCAFNWRVKTSILDMRQLLFSELIISAPNDFSDVAFFSSQFVTLMIFSILRANFFSMDMHLKWLRWPIHIVHSFKPKKNKSDIIWLYWTLELFSALVFELVFYTSLVRRNDPQSDRVWFFTGGL